MSDLAGNANYAPTTATVQAPPCIYTKETMIHKEWLCNAWPLFCICFGTPQNPDDWRWNGVSGRMRFLAHWLVVIGVFFNFGFEGRNGFEVYSVVVQLIPLFSSSDEEGVSLLACPAGFDFQASVSIPGVAADCVAGLQWTVSYWSDLSAWFTKSKEVFWRHSRVEVFWRHAWGLQWLGHNLHLQVSRPLQWCQKSWTVSW